MWVAWIWCMLWFVLASSIIYDISEMWHVLTNNEIHGKLLQGVPSATEIDSHGLPSNFESGEIHIAGLVVSSYSWEHSHWAARRSLSEWLVEKGVPGIYGVDTRALTKKIREVGAMLGNIVVVSTILRQWWCVICCMKSSGIHQNINYTHYSCIFLRDLSTQSLKPKWLPLTTLMLAIS